MSPFTPLRWAFRILALALLVVLAVPAVTAARVWWTARTDDRSNADVILVLGAAQFDGRPSPVFQARLDHAAELYRDGVATEIMTVGGKRSGDRFTEAAAGRRYLIDQGIPSRAVTAVPYGRDTQTSLEAAARSMNEQSVTSAVIVTDPYHSLRSRTMARDLGMDAWTSPPTSGPAGSTISRETGAYLYYLFAQRPGIEPVVGQ